MPADRAPTQPSSYECTHSGYGIHPAIFECVECGLLSSAGASQETVLSAYREVEDPLYLREEDSRVATFGRRLARIEKLRRPPGRLLDVGAYTGTMVEVAGRRGWTASGIEPSRWAAGEARARGLDVVEGTLDSAGFAEGSFDVVTMWDVIEHISDPISLLHAAARLLGKGGVLVVHTMDVGSLTANLMRGRWPWLMEMHLHYFSRRTLARSLESTGFRAVRIFAEGRRVSAGYFATRVGGVCGDRVGRALSWAVGRAGLSGVEVPVNFGDLMTAYAVKE